MARRWPRPAVDTELLMKRLLLLALCLCSLSACDTAKRSRLSSDTLRIAIDPPAVNGVIVFNSTMTLNAVCRSPQSPDPDVTPVWTVENNLGTFDPATGKKVIFTAGSIIGTGAIYASIGSVRSPALSISVAHSTSAVVKTVLPIYSDEGLIAVGIHIPDIYKWGQKDSVIPGTGNPGLTESSGGGAPGDAAAYMTDPSGVESYVGWGITLDKNDTTFKADFAAYAAGTIKFYLKTNRALAGFERVFINVEEANKTKNPPLVITAGYGWNHAVSSWQEVTVPVADITGVNLANIHLPFEITVDNLSSPITMDVDDVRWER